MRLYNVSHYIGMDFTEKGWDGMDWIHVSQVRDQLLDVANPVTHLQVPQKRGNFFTS